MQGAGKEAETPTDEVAPGAADIQTVTSGPDALPGTLDEVVEPEQPAEPDDDVEAPTRTAWLFRERATPREVALDELATLAADDESFLWVDLSGHDADDLELIGRELDLPPGAVRIALAGWQRPRVGVFRDRYFVALTVPRGDLATQRVLASELDLFVGRNYLVSTHKQPLPFTAQVLARARQNPALLKLDSAFLLFILIDELLAQYEALTEGLQDEIEAMEERALTDASDTLLEDLLHLKRFVFAIYRLAGQHRPVLEAFLRPDFPFTGGEDIEPYFRDVDARLSRLVDGLDAAKESVNGAFEIYVSQVSQRANEIMKVLAIVSTVLLPASVILGFFGTSFENPSFATVPWFIVMIILILLTTVGAIALFTRWGWLGSATSSGAARRAPRRPPP